MSLRSGWERAHLGSPLPRLRGLAARVLLCAALAGCTSHGATVMSEVPAAFDSRPAIVFVPGYYGSALRNRATGHRVFLTGMQAYFGNEALSLFQSELGTPRGPELEVEGVLGAVTILPGIYELNVYAPLIHRLRQIRPDAQVIPLAYDWRADLTETVTKISETVNALTAKGCKSITLVSHSMGGLAVEYYLAYGTQLPPRAAINWAGARFVKRAVFMGTPFNGSMIAFATFDKGSGLPYSDRMLSADTMSSFPSLYELLPSTATLYDKAGNKTTVDLYNPDLWRRNHFGLFKRSKLPAAYLEQRDHFTTGWLTHSRMFSERIQLGQTAAWQPPATLKVLNIVGSDRKTLDAGYIDPPTGTLYFAPKDLQAIGLKEDPLYNNGDGSVTLSSAAVPAALETATRQVVVRADHDKLFLDAAADSAYKDFLEKEADSSLAEPLPGDRAGDRALERPASGQD